MAFSVSITKGFTLKNITKMQTLWFGIFFGGFQVLIPLLNYISGTQLEQLVSEIVPLDSFHSSFIPWAKNDL
ncbi:manganese efflux pump MntP [Candidatus Methanobinarius endosymbioticus]|uniref:Manganese efflux pump MntP n=1 Tax=Candidatus Methanobinarius endosymbioticus TaxID=2006182 RepID=A0A366MB23_9EURY|nr:manganese efflux pump MntP [Candidatus Methanobinarius endosymbioticus]